MDPVLRPVIEGAGGSSPYLSGLIQREADWLADALRRSPEESLTEICVAAKSLSPEQTVPGLRLAKRRAALLIALADLTGVFSLDETTGALTGFAEIAVQKALEVALLPILRRGGIPGKSETDAGTGAGLTILAMGKMGAKELNYSSDIDLICLFDDAQFDPDDLGEARSGFIKAVRGMTNILSDTKSDGYVFRTDLRLRPDASVTPVAISMEAAERYYEAQGRTWERAAFIKARSVAGDVVAGNRFVEALKQFVWRRHLDFWAIEDAHAMRLKIRDAKGLYKSDGYLGRDLKLGIGGIREIEFFAQTRQLIAGGRDPGLRSPKTTEALTQLANAGWIQHSDAAMLASEYVSHRMMEHRVQMVADQQTHLLPKTEDEFARLAALSDADPSEMAVEVEARFARVHDLVEGFFTPQVTKAAAPELPDQAEDVLLRWPDYPALRSDRAREIFERVRPRLLDRIGKAADPMAALGHVDGFLAGLPAGVQVFSLFDANPVLLDLVVDISDTAPALAGYLSRNSGVFDAVIGGSFFTAWPGRAALSEDLSSHLETASDYEAKLDVARVWAREWHFRTGVHHLRGLISGTEVGYQYEDLARAVLEAIWPVVVENFARRHGPPPGRGAAVLGMGSLGAGTLAAASDLDLVVIFDPDGAETSEGSKPLPSVTYYARLTQAFVTALTAPTAEGRLYEVDMRLRPSGRQGPVATALSSFIRYQTNDAWTWEHLALTRGRPVAGSERLMAEVEAFRRDLIAGPRRVEKVLKDVAEMRDRLAAVKPGEGGLNMKTGPGRMQDIELFASAGALLAGSPTRAVRRQLNAGADALQLSETEVSRLVEAYDLYAGLRQVLVLIGGMPKAGTGGAKLLLDASNSSSLENLEQDVAAVAQDVGAVIEARLKGR